MAFTVHGHHIPGTVLGDDRPVNVARCGGVTHCKQCHAEGQSYHEDHKPAESLHFEEQAKTVEWNIDENRPSTPAEIIPMESKLEKDLGHLLNSHSAENESGTPDFILAMYLKAQLDLFNQTIRNRAAWRSESVELPALIELRKGEKTVPLVIYTDGQRNEVGTAAVNVTPGEVHVTGKIIGALPIFEEMLTDPNASFSVPEPEKPTGRFGRYLKEGLTDNGK